MKRDFLIIEHSKHTDLSDLELFSPMKKNMEEVPLVFSKNQLNFHQHRSLPPLHDLKLQWFYSNLRTDNKAFCVYQ